VLLSTGGNHEVFLLSTAGHRRGDGCAGSAEDLAGLCWGRSRLPWRLYRLVFGFYAASELGRPRSSSRCLGLRLGACRCAGNREQRTERRLHREHCGLQFDGDILLPLANGAFISLAYYSVLEDSAIMRCCPG